MSSDVVFERQYRTPTSEGYRLHRGGMPVAQIELHYAHTVVYCSLVLLEDLAEPELRAAIDEIDNRLVQSAEVPREDFLVTVYRGQEVGFLNDDILSRTRYAEESQ